MTERTLAIVKPDAVRQNAIGRIIHMAERCGMKVVELQMLTLTPAQAEIFYRQHLGRPYFERLIAMMTGGPCVVIVLEGEGAVNQWRTLMGPTDPRRAPATTIRGLFGTEIPDNAVHGSDGPESAAAEINIFFPTR